MSDVNTSLTLTAILLGKARTPDSNLHEVTLKIQSDILTLRLTPDAASVFPDLSHVEGGGHPLYRVVISPILPEPTEISPLVETVATPSTAPDPDATDASPVTDAGVDPVAA